MLETSVPHREYRSFEEPWLDELPAHWKSLRVKHLLRERNVRGFPNEPLLAATQSKGVIRKEDYGDRTVVATKDLHLLKLVRVGDFVISLRSFQGGIEQARHQGIISPAYTVLSTDDEDLRGYLSVLFKSAPFISNLTLHVTGIRQGQNIDYTTLSRSRVPVPPPEEQNSIAAFVKAANRRVNRLIRNKRRLIELLNEQKQVIITQAVTRGLDPNVSLKPTGNDFFPHVPQGWMVMPLRRVIRRTVDGPHHTPRYLDDGVLFISARNIKVDSWSLADAKYISQADYEALCERVKPEKGDVLYTKGGTTGVARAVDFDTPFQVWVHVAVLKLRHDAADPEYLALALNSTPCYQQSQLFTRGATNQDLGLNRMKAIHLPIPPTLEEQRRIVATVNKQSVQLMASVDRAQREIDLLREYRTRLVADVVTGKVDVRHLADEMEEELAGEEPEAPIDAEPMLEEEEADLLEEAVEDGRAAG